jgi:hypothetical protein
MEPGRIEASYGRGRLLVRLGRHPEALEVVQKGLKTYPKHTGLQHLLRILQSKQGMVREELAPQEYD